MAVKKRTVKVTDEEYAALQAARTVSTVAPESATKDSAQEHSALANALVEAINLTRPPEKKTVFTRKKGTPWTPPEGVERSKLKRKMYQHGNAIEERLSNDEIDLLNKIRPGHYCEGHVKVGLRKDRGLNIDYPVKTASDRLKLVNLFGLRTFKELLERIVDERVNPGLYKRPDDLDFDD
jgi:hypothetical protein